MSNNNPSNALSIHSVQSLFLETQLNGETLGTATGFVADSPWGPSLLTNWHVVSGRRPDNNKILSNTGHTPDSIVIMHNKAGSKFEWIRRIEPLYGSDGQPLWREHPTFGNRVDIAALPLTQLEEVQLYPSRLGIGDKPILCGPSDIVSVIGFPFGLTGGRSLAVWASGFIATETKVNYNELPLFLIDSRSRKGQSGSPVIAFRSGGAVQHEGGGGAIYNGPVSRFLGIYSGRIHAESDLGMVWKASAIHELLKPA